MPVEQVEQHHAKDDMDAAIGRQKVRKLKREGYSEKDAERALRLCSNSVIRASRLLAEERASVSKRPAELNVLTSQNGQDLDALRKDKDLSGIPTDLLLQVFMACARNREQTKAFLVM